MMPSFLRVFGLGYPMIAHLFAHPIMTVLTWMTFYVECCVKCHFDN